MLGRVLGQKKIDTKPLLKKCDRVSMTSLGSAAAPDCHTGQSKGRYRTFNPSHCHCLLVLKIISEYDAGPNSIFSICEWKGFANND